MGPRELARWQWHDYAWFHQSRANLAIHIVAVPLFLLGNVAMLAGLAVLDAWVAVGGALLSALAFAVQGAGHKGETLAPKPFTGPLNVVGRMLTEQWVTFPRFVISGGWAKAWRDADPASP